MRNQTSVLDVANPPGLSNEALATKATKATKEAIFEVFLCHKECTKVRIEKT